MYIYVLCSIWENKCTKWKAPSTNPILPSFGLLRKWPRKVRRLWSTLLARVQSPSTSSHSCSNAPKLDRRETFAGVLVFYLYLLQANMLRKPFPVKNV